MAGAVAGCGGSSGDASGNSGQTYSVVADTTVTTGEVAPANYVPQINEICRKAWVTIVNNFKDYSSWHKEDGSKKKRFIESVQLSLLAGIEFHIFDSIYRLGTPPGEEHEVEEIIGPLQSAIERGQRSLAPVASKAQVEALFDEYNQRARLYGFDDCLVDMAHLKEIKV